VAVGAYDPQSLLMILPIGLITVAILHANNTRDVKTDLQAGLGTITTSVSLMNAKAIYTFEIFAPYALALLYVVLLGQPWTLLAVVLTLPLALRNVRTMIQAEDDLPYRGIQRLDQTTAQLQMAFGLLYALGFFLGSWLGV
jgi:1,4-dihydroxy-2-naphthoate octaprenyltransferase